MTFHPKNLKHGGPGASFLVESLVVRITPQSAPTVSNLNFIEKQIDLDEDIAKHIEDNWWDLI